jgi:hypothetical protein
VPTVHTALPDALQQAVDAVLREAGVEHVAHGDAKPVRAGELAAGDADAVALIGPQLSRAVAHAVEATRPAGLPLLAPAATWVGVTRDDEPGCDDPADHGHTIFRLVARDSVVAERIAMDVHASGRPALVIAGEHEYGVQLDAQLRLAGLPRTSEPADADLIVLCGLADQPELERVTALDPMPVYAFDGVQGSRTFAGTDREVFLALPHGPAEGFTAEHLVTGVVHAGRMATLVVELVEAGATDRAAMLDALRSHRLFDEHGDTTEPEVWLWRVGPRWELEPHRPLDPL